MQFTKGLAFNASYNARQETFNALGIPSILKSSEFSRACIGFSRNISYLPEDFQCLPCGGNTPSFLVLGMYRVSKKKGICEARQYLLTLFLVPVLLCIPSVSLNFHRYFFCRYQTWHGNKHNKDFLLGLMDSKGIFCSGKIE